jgi:hypothetical protein
MTVTSPPGDHQSEPRPSESGQPEQGRDSRNEFLRRWERERILVPARSRAPTAQPTETAPLHSCIVALNEPDQFGCKLRDVSELAFPNDKNPPPKATELVDVSPITLSRPVELRFPLLHVGRRKRLPRPASVPVPETPVNQDYATVLWQNDVWAPRQITLVCAVTIAKSPKNPANEHLRLGVRTGDFLHPRRGEIIG